MAVDSFALNIGLRLVFFGPLRLDLVFGRVQRFRFISLFPSPRVGRSARKNFGNSVVNFSCLNSAPRIPAVESGRSAGRSVVLEGSKSTPPLVIRATPKGGAH